MTRLIFVVCLLGSCLSPGLAGPVDCASGSAECQGQDILLMLQARLEQTNVADEEEEDQKEPDEGSVAMEESDEDEEAEREDEDEDEVEEDEDKSTENTALTEKEGAMDGSATEGRRRRRRRDRRRTQALTKKEEQKANETTFGDAKGSCPPWALERVYACSEGKGSCSKIRRNVRCGWCEPNWFNLCKTKALWQCAMSMWTYPLTSHGQSLSQADKEACYNAACAGYDHCQEKLCCSALGPPWDECHKQCMAVKGRQETYQIGKVYSKSCLKRKKAAQKSGCLRSLAETFAGRDAANESNEEAATERETEESEGSGYSLDESMSDKRTCG